MESNLNFQEERPLKNRQKVGIINGPTEIKEKEKINTTITIVRWPDIHTPERSEINSGRSLKSRLMGTLNPSTESPSRCGYLLPSQVPTSSHHQQLIDCDESPGLLVFIPTTAASDIYLLCLVPAFLVSSIFRKTTNGFL
jgi:hypothetical protein